MTFWDNPQMVISHIRHSCVTSDDTGMCEMVIVQDEPDIFTTNKKKKVGMLNIDEGGEHNEYSQSFDIAVSPGLMGRTPKTNQYKLKRKPEHTCKTIHWNDQLEEMSISQKDEMFEEKDLPLETDTANNENESLKNVSLLSQLLEESLYEPSNPYKEYQVFDGEGLEDTCPTKQINIFLVFLPVEKERDQLLSISVLDTATVRDLIGLVLYKSCFGGRENRVLRDIRSYALYIAEKDGTVDTDFPPLDDKDKFSKFDFHYLALDEKDKQKQGSKNVSVKIQIQHNGYSVVKVDRTDVLMRTILEKIQKKRSLKAGQYQLEKEGEGGKFVDLDASLESTGTLTFTLVKMSSAGGSRRTEDKELNNQHASSAQDEILSVQYKSYQVLLVQRFSSTEVSLGVHGQNIEIDPKHITIFSKIKPISLDFDNIADCEITDEKPGGRASFRIYYKKSDDFKHYEFETTSHVAQEVVKKIYNILKSRSQRVRTEFLNSRKGDKTKRR